MSQRIRLSQGAFALEDDRFTTVADDEAPPPGDIIVSVARFQADGDALLAQGRAVGVRVAADQSVDDLAYDLPRISVVALEFPKYRDGRAYTGARLLRERYSYAGEIRPLSPRLSARRRWPRAGLRGKGRRRCPLKAPNPSAWPSG
jgi:uncharacterized protein (DUF934 family)